MKPSCLQRPFATCRLLGLACVMLLTSGCAVYQYDVVSPAPLAGRVGGDADKVLDVNPLIYRLRSVDNRLVIRVYNPTQDPIEIVGVRSTVVDPYGQSHPLRGETIAPRTYIKIRLPCRGPPTTTKVVRTSDWVSVSVAVTTITGRSSAVVFFTAGHAITTLSTMTASSGTG